VSVCLSVCKHLRKSLLLPEKSLDRHQTCTRWSSEEPASRMCSRLRSRSKVTWYGHFCDFTKVASWRRQKMAATQPNLHVMVPSPACIQDVLKVKVEVKGHVIRALLWCDEMFAIQYGLTFCLYVRSLCETPLYSPSSISIRQLDLMSTYWNELLPHWWSSYWCIFNVATPDFVLVWDGSVQGWPI